jgi:hypothetical protein
VRQRKLPVRRVPRAVPARHRDGLAHARVSVDGELENLEQAKRARAAFAFIEKTKLPELKETAASYEGWVERWWQPWRARESFFAELKDDTSYTMEVWNTFPWPQDPTDEQVVAVATAGRALRRVRGELMEQNGWSLRALYQAAEVEGPHPLKDAQTALSTDCIEPPSVGRTA